MASSISDVENVPEFLSFDHVTDGMRPANGAKGLLENWPMRIRPSLRVSGWSPGPITRMLRPSTALPNSNHSELERVTTDAARNGSWKHHGPS